MDAHRACMIVCDGQPRISQHITVRVLGLTPTYFKLLGDTTGLEQLLNPLCHPVIFWN
jgi:hypothetical protein